MKRKLAHEKERVSYRSNAPTPRQLAERLAKRCLSELRPSVTMKEARATSPTSKHSAPVRYLVSKIAAVREGQEFLIAEQHLVKSMYEMTSYSNEWVAQIIVTPELDVVLRDQHGESDREKIERIVLGCALRGPD